MSIPVPHTVDCPNCGNPIKFTMWQSINTEMDFAIPDIISGKLFQIECGTCGYQTHVDYPILFNDMVHNMMIYYSRPEGVQEAEKACEDILQYCSRARIVTSQNDLREKAMILNDGLDDRLVEILKFLMRPELQDQMPEHQIEHIYYNGSKGEFALEVLYDTGSAVATLSREHYNVIEQRFGPLLDDKNTPYFVDEDWAMAFLDDGESPQNED